MDKAKRLVALTFSLEQECSRGTWSTKKEIEKLIAFVENFEDNVKKAELIINKTKEEDKGFIW